MKKTKISGYSLFILCREENDCGILSVEDKAMIDTCSYWLEGMLLVR
jgi:hypothetical protein